MSSCAAFFKKSRIIKTLFQQRRNKGVGAAAKGFGRQQAHASDGPRTGLDTGNLGCPNRTSRKGKLGGRHRAAVRVTVSAKPGLIVPAGLHLPASIARSCQRVPSVFRISPMVEGSDKAAKKTSPRPLCSSSARPPAGLPLSVKLRCARFLLHLILYLSESRGPPLPFF